MSLLGARSTGKLPARITVNSFCDVCAQLRRVTRVETVYGIKWLCEEHQARRPVPVETLSDTQIADVHEVENAVLAVQAIDDAIDDGLRDLAGELLEDEPIDDDDDLPQCQPLEDEP